MPCATSGQTPAAQAFQPFTGWVLVRAVEILALIVCFLLLVGWALAPLREL
jgi:hypothetical protein